MTPWLEVFGRLHPALVHLPIGLLVGLAMVEAVAALRRRTPSPETVLTLLIPAVISAVLAAGAGYVLSREPGYEETTVTTHLILGLIVAAGAVAALILRRKTRAYRTTIAITVVLLLPTGHFGAILTHGKGFVTAPLKEASADRPRRSGPRVPLASVNTSATSAVSLNSAESAPRTETGDMVSPSGRNTATLPAAVAEPTQFETRIAPLLKTYCTECHGDQKTKGGLGLHTAEALRAGGDSGSVVIPGNADESELVRRMRLPLDDRDHMPPEGKRQPSASDVALIEDWINRGAAMPGVDTSSSNEATAAESPTPRAPTPSPAADEHSPAQSRFAAQSSAPPPPPDPVALTILRERLIHVSVRSVGETELVLDFSAAASVIGDAEVTELLSPLIENIADLSLSRSQITDAILPFLARLPRLYRLDLRHTFVTTNGITALKEHPRLEELILAQTLLTDRAVDALVRMPALKRVFLWDSGIGPEGLAALKRRRPDLRIDAGNAAAADVLDAETAVVLGSAATTPSPESPTASPDALRPINDVCPVSGRPVDPKYLIVSRGRVVGFCCPNCPGPFWSDPDRYPVKPRE